MGGAQKVPDLTQLIRSHGMLFPPLCSPFTRYLPTRAPQVSNRPHTASYLETPEAPRFPRQLVLLGTHGGKYLETVSSVDDWFVILHYGPCPWPCDD